MRLGAKLGLQVGKLAASGAGAGRVATLGHEARNHPMKHDAVVKAILGQRGDPLDMARRQVGYGRGGRMQIEQDRAEIVSGVLRGETIGAPIALWIGNRDGANQVLQKDPSLLDAETRGYAHLPGGHQEAWADAFCNLMREIYATIGAGAPYPPMAPMVATFEDGLRANRIVDAILASAEDGGAWTRV